MRTPLFALLALFLTTLAHGQVRPIASYDFSSNLAPVQPQSGWASVGPITATGANAVQFGRLCILDQWPDSGGYFEFTVDPGIAPLRLTHLQVDYIGSQTPTINDIRVTSSLDNHTNTLFERIEDMNDFIGSFRVDLTGITEMRDVQTPVAIRVSLARTAGWSSPAHYEVDNVVLYGDDKPPTTACVGNGSASLRVLSSDNALIESGSDISIQMVGTPSAVNVLVIDPLGGALDLFPFGELCSTLSPSAIVLPNVFGATGQLAYDAVWPSGMSIDQEELCMLFLDVPTLALEDIHVSNRVCVEGGRSCEDEMERLQLLTSLPYMGTFPVQVEVEARKDDDHGDVIGTASALVDADGTWTGTSTDVEIQQVWVQGPSVRVLFEIDAENFESGHLSHDTWVSTGVGSVFVEERIHTHCTHGFGPGLVFGDFTVMEAVSENETDECRAGRKPAILRLTYTGHGCADTSHSQDPNRVTCTGSVDGANSVYVRASDKNDPDDDNAKVWFEGWVSRGETFELHATDAEEEKLKSDTYLHAFLAPGGTPIHTVKFHTSCSQPISLGDRFGSFRVAGFEDLDDTDECRGNVRPSQLVMRYDGWDCARTRHGQDANEVDCSGDPEHMVRVWIRASDKSNANDRNAKVWFEGWVDLGDEYTLDAAAAGESRLKNDTHIHVFDTPGGFELQYIKFHSSCSERIRTVDQFGAMRLRLFVPE